MRYPANYKQSIDPQVLTTLPRFCRYAGSAPDLAHLRDLTLELATVEQVVYIGEREAIEVEMPDGTIERPWMHVAIQELDANGKAVIPAFEPIPKRGPNAMSTADLGLLGWTDASLADKSKELFGEEYEPDRPGPSDKRRALFDRVMKATFG